MVGFNESFPTELMRLIGTTWTHLQSSM